MDVDAGAQLFTVLSLMFAGALACGCLPFFMRVREAHLQTVAALGAGLLIGSALGVIVPEGFHAFAEATAHDHAHEEVEDHDHGHGHEHEGGVPEGVAGLVLVAGFLFMLLLDHLQHAAGGSCSAPAHSHAHGHGHGHSHHHHHSHSPGSSGSQGQLKEAADGKAAAKGKQSGAAAPSDTAAAAAAAAPVGERQPAAQSECSGKLKAAAPTAAAAAGDPRSAIMGLLIHCCADGLAMGAAFLSGNARLSMIIAAAMILHKAPMAFGLAAYLMTCRWTFQRSQPTLVAFAAAAPAATLATYCLLGSLAVLKSHAAVALCVIFSGGTFLHAATMHILPEALSNSGGRMSGAQLAAVLVGSLLPVALSWGHHH